jgi:hypothetical protein
MAAQAPTLRPAFCEQKRLLEQQFDTAVRELMELHQAEIRVRMHGAEAQRFELAIELAQQKRGAAKSRLLAHVRKHCC